MARKVLDMEGRYKLGKLMAVRYKKQKKKERGEILERFTEVTGYNRCYAGWLLRNWGRKVVIYNKGEQYISVITIHTSPPMFIYYYLIRTFIFILFSSCRFIYKNFSIQRTCTNTDHQIHGIYPLPRVLILEDFLNRYP